MKNTLFLSVIGLLFLATFSCTRSEAPKEETQISDQKMLRHVVLFKFKDSSSVEDVRSVEAAFRNLQNEIPEIKAFEWGTNNSPEGLDDGFTHVFFVSFTSEEDRAVYLPHPKHKEFVEILKPHLDKALVVDYWAEK
ncbi:MAG: hypothetical protein ABS46_14555 [Cytophagaceae bacterium SCN 52-12]|nr:MAG: hypothetical protein ABS46_14555 [Cytophagaceae bacterium SCN 52-12]